MEPERRACKLCGAPLVFVSGPTGKILALDERARTYVVKVDGKGNASAVATDSLVSHQYTCLRRTR